MSDSTGTLELLAGELALIFEPIARRIEDDSAASILEWLGLRPPDAASGASDLASALSTAVAAAAALPDLIAALSAAIDSDDDTAVLKAGSDIVAKISVVVQAARAISNALSSLSASAPGLTPQQKAELAAFADEFVDRLTSRLFVEYLEARFPQLALPLMATGVIEIADDEGGPDDSLNGAYTRKTFHFDRATKLFTDPVGLLGDVFKWGDPAFDGIALFGALKSLLERKLEIPAELLTPPGAPAMLEAFAFNAEVDNSVTPPGLDIDLRFSGALDSTETVTEGDWQIAFTAKADFESDLSVTVRPLLDITLNTPAASADLGFQADFSRATSAAPFLLLGQAGGSRLEIQSPTAGVGFTLHFDPAASQAQLTPELKLGLRGGRMVISGQGSDSFIGTLLSGRDLEANFDTDVRWNPHDGLAFEGSAAIEIALPTHISIGPLDIITLYLRAGIASDGSIPIELSGGFKAALGPLEASVDRLGVIATLRWPKGGGNLGPVDLGFAFKPPNGIGLSIDAGIVKGGGFLYIDTDRGEYAGALELVFGDFLGLHAVGLISTRMPDGSSGFSLLVIITADFGSGIQLGFGFTLRAVGGLLGLNRSVLFQPLLDGVRNDSIESVMFPHDVVANAPRIISDLRAIFPPHQGTFLIGPMAKLGWGTPTLVSLSLGIIVEIPPGDIAILGVLKVALPADELAILELQVNFVGMLEFDKKRLYFFAALYDSHLLFITIEGEMGVLFAYGDDANFVLSVGGFHPRFNPPPLPFPTPRRIQVDIINESYARIRCDGYFAVTTNTLQFGSHSEYFFGFSALSVEGHSGFDALFQFSPFHFVVEISTSFSVHVFGMGVYGVDVDLTLEGPTPWHAHGTASISFLFFSIGIGIDVTWGDSRDTTLPPITVMPLITGEFAQQTNWRAILPSGSNLLVSLRKLDTTGADFVLHPVGTLHVSQRAIPLDLVLDKVGNQKPTDVNRITLSVAGGGLAKTGDVDESFAPAQFKNMDDAAKLSQPAYQPQHGGIELSAAGNVYGSGTAITREVRYHLTIVDTTVARRRFYVFLGSLFVHFLRGASVTQNVFSAARKAQLQPFAEKIVVTNESFAVANQSDNTVYHADAAAFSSQAAANDFMEREVARDPALAGTLHVLPHFELAA